MPDDFFSKVDNLPEPVKKLLHSNELAEFVYQINTSYGLSEEKCGLVAGLIGSLIVNDIPLEKFEESLKNEISLPPEIAAGIALNITKNIFLPLKEFFPNAESLISDWQSRANQPTQKPKSLFYPEEKTEKNTEPKREVKTVSVRPFREAIKENQEVLNQLLTANPIKTTANFFILLSFPE